MRTRHGPLRQKTRRSYRMSHLLPRPTTARPRSTSPRGDTDRNGEGTPGRKARWGGSTLLELLVVTAVVAILAALLFPVLAQARARAHRTRCLAQLGQLSRAHLLYLQDWDDRFPDWVQPGPPRPEPYGPRWFWPEFLGGYVRDTRLFEDPGTASGPLSSAEVRLADYILLTWRQAGRRGDPGEPAQRWPGPPLGLADVARPGETISLMDGWTTTRRTRGGILRHGRGMNACFVDGHAGWLSWEELWRVDMDEDGMYWLHYGAAHR